MIPLCKENIYASVTKRKKWWSSRSHTHFPDKKNIRVVYAHGWGNWEKPKNKEKIKTKLVGLGQWFENYNQEKPTFISKSLGHGSY